MKHFRFLEKTLVVLLLWVSCQMPMAQSNLYLKLNTQSTQSILINSIKKITFNNGDLVFNYQNNTSNSFPFSSIFRITFNPNTSVGNVILNEAEFSIYPNPVVNKFFVNGLNDTDVSITIYQLNGRMVYHSAMSDFRSGVDVSDLQAGLYLVKVNNQTLKISKL